MVVACINAETDSRKIVLVRPIFAGPVFFISVCNLLFIDWWLEFQFFEGVDDLLMTFDKGVYRRL